MLMEKNFRIVFDQFKKNNFTKTHVSMKYGVYIYLKDHIVLIIFIFIVLFYE